jgi:hypothetical protein
VSTAPWIETQASVFTRNRGTIKVFIGPKDTPGSRQASITVGDETFEVEQKGITCKIASLTPAVATFMSTGGEGKFVVSSQTGCTWEATVDGAAAAWITIPSGASGTGVGEVTYTVAAKEPGKRRTGRISVSLTEGFGLKKTFTVIQDRN